MRNGATLRVRFRVTVISSGAAQVDYVHCEASRSLDASPFATVQRDRVLELREPLGQLARRRRREELGVDIRQFHGM